MPVMRREILRVLNGCTPELSQHAGARMQVADLVIKRCGYSYAISLCTCGQVVSCLCCARAEPACVQSPTAIVWAIEDRDQGIYRS